MKFEPTAKTIAMIEKSLKITGMALIFILVAGFLFISVEKNDTKPTDKIEVDKYFTETPGEKSYITINVKGAVKTEGECTVERGSTVEEVLKNIKLTETADINRLAKNKVVEENAVLYIPEINAEKIKEGEEYLLVNINTAGFEELQLLSGVGEKMAVKIIEYREKTGGKFKEKEQLMEIEGFGKGMYNKLKFNIEL